MVQDGNYSSLPFRGDRSDDGCTCHRPGRDSQLKGARPVYFFNREMPGLRPLHDVVIERCIYVVCCDAGQNEKSKDDAEKNSRTLLHCAGRLSGNLESVYS